MDKTITLTLPDLFVGQILDVLRQEQEAWVYTRSYFLGEPLDMDRLIKDGSTAEGARKMVDYYQEIIDAVERQY
ncbi:MAG: hypothetical protein QGH60_00510 [Phycisphaerae bacterium]|jgi:hypothetical protein|nr:hypothetical protein [Phycisphaerae bacterium]